MKEWDEFKEIVSENIHREGIDDLMTWIDGTDFKTAPSSTRYHGACDGGLVRHSLRVYKNLLDLTRHYATQFPEVADIKQESVAIVSLFHDICKIGCYKRDTRNVKDERGVWHKVPCYKFDEDFSFGGHGSKSMFLVQNFMHLEPEEAAAINCHMGAYDMTTYSNPSNVFSRNPLAFLLHVADMTATHMNGE